MIVHVTKVESEVEFDVDSSVVLKQIGSSHNVTIAYRERLSWDYSTIKFFRAIGECPMQLGKSYKITIEEVKNDNP